MSTKSTHRSRGTKPRSFGILALVASMSLALAGLVGLGLAPAASAALVCPDGYTLNGSTCEKYETQPADAETIYSCPDGWTGPVEGDDGMECSRQTQEGYDYQDATKEYSCESGDLVKVGDHWKCKTVDQQSPGSESYCTTGELVNHDGGKACKVEVKCVDEDSVETEHNTKCYEYNTPLTRPTCDTKDGYSYNSDSGKCEKAEYASADFEWVCAAGWTPDWSQVGTLGDYVEHPTPQCKMPHMVTETEEADSWIAYTCPDGWNGPLPEVESAIVDESPVEPYCERTLTTTPTDDTPPVVKQAGPTVDFCPNLAGVQWENYDCNTGKAPAVVESATVAAPAVVAPPEAAAVVAPAAATVAVPAAATVPASVPAGDGSQAPGLPMWALAMIAVGVLGAGFAGKSILAARK